MHGSVHRVTRVLAVLALYDCTKSCVVARLLHLLIEGMCGYAQAYDPCSIPCRLPTHWPENRQQHRHNLAAAILHADGAHRNGRADCQSGELKRGEQRPLGTVEAACTLEDLAHDTNGVCEWRLPLGRHGRLEVKLHQGHDNSVDVVGHNLVECSRSPTTGKQVTTHLGAKQNCSQHNLTFDRLA